MATTVCRIAITRLLGVVGEGRDELSVPEISSHFSIASSGWGALTPVSGDVDDVSHHDGPEFALSAANPPQPKEST